MGSCGGAVNRDDIPEGGIHLSTETHAGRVRERDRAAAGNNKRRESQLEPRCARFPFRVLLVLGARLCLRNLPSKFRDQRILNLEVEDNACQCTCFGMSNHIAAFARLRPPTQAARYARARSSISRDVPARAKVANVSNWMRFGPQDATKYQPYHEILIRCIKITHSRQVANGDNYGRLLGRDMEFWTRHRFLRVGVGSMQDWPVRSEASGRMERAALGAG
jgi:hypothetical protein